MTTTAVAPAVFGFCEAAAANLRQKDDHWNTAIGSFIGGFVGGLSRMLLGEETANL